MNKIKWSFLYLVLVTFSGCTSRVYQAPEIDIPNEWHSDISASMLSCPSECSNWWERLQDPLLNELMVYAALQNLDLKIAAMQVLEAEGQKNCVFSQQDSLDNAWIAVSSEIAKNYIELRGFQQQLIIMQRTFQVQENVVELTRELLQRGTVNDIALNKAYAEWSGLKAQMSLVELNIARIIHHVSILLGAFPGDLFECLQASGSLPQVPIDMPIGMPCELLCRRPDVRKAEKELAAVEGVNNIIFNKCGKFIRQEALYNYQKTILTALEEVENAISAYRHEEDHCRQLAEVYQRHKKTYEFAEQLYEEGFDDYLELAVNAKILLASEEAHVKCQVEVLLNYVSLYKALGGSW